MTTDTTPAPAPGADRTSAPHSRQLIGEFGWIWVALLGIIILSLVTEPGTLRSETLVNTLPLAGILAIVAIGQTLVIQQRGLDLSVPGTITLCGIVMADAVADGTSLPLGLLAGLFAAVVVGLVNGVLISRFSVTPLIATLAVNSLAIGTVIWVSGGFPENAADKAKDFSTGKVIGIPYTVIVAAIFVAGVTFVYNRTVIGKRFVAVGANPDTARAAGVVVRRYVIGTYVAAALCFGIAGILLTGFIGTATTDMGNRYLLPSITAVVVGGTPFTGGRGSVIASAAAALFMTQLDVLVVAMGGSAAIQLLMQAIVLVAATSIRSINFTQLLGLKRATAR